MSLCQGLPIIIQEKHPFKAQKKANVVSFQSKIFHRHKSEKNRCISQSKIFP